MKNLISLTLLVLSICGQLIAQELPYLKQSAFKGGEKLEYKLKYGFLSAATGQLTVTDTKTGSGGDAFRLYATGKTAGAFALYTVKNEYNSYIDAKTFLPYYYTENIREGGYRRNDKVT